MILLDGTNVIEGTGKCISIAIGKHSQKGIIRGTLYNASEDNKKSFRTQIKYHS